MYANGYFVLLPLAVKHDMSKLQYTSFGFIFVMQGKIKMFLQYFNPVGYFVFILMMVRNYNNKSNSINGIMFFIQSISSHHIQLWQVMM